MTQSQAIVRRMFSAAAHKVGGAAALASRLNLTDGEVQQYLSGVLLPTEPVLVGVLEIILAELDGIRTEFAAEAWLTLWKECGLRVPPA